MRVVIAQFLVIVWNKLCVAIMARLRRLRIVNRLHLKAINKSINAITLSKMP